MSVEIKGYVLVNDAKYRRCFDKEIGAGPEATDDQILTYYAKFGGLIKKDAKVEKSTKKGEGDKVTGGEVVPNSKFWNFAENKPVKIEKPKEEPKVEEKLEVEEKPKKEKSTKEVKTKK